MKRLSVFLLLSLSLPFFAQAQVLLPDSLTQLMVRVKRGHTAAEVQDFLRKKGLSGTQPFQVFAAEGESARRIKPSKSGVYLSDYWRIDLPADRKPDLWLKQLQAQDWVGYVEPVLGHQLLKATAYTPNDPYISTQWHINACKFPQAWALSKGNTETIIGIIDSGMDLLHPDLAANIYRNEAEWSGTPGVDDDGNGFVDDRNGYNFADINTNVSDRYFHGTQVGGAAGAMTDNGVGVTGAAFNCKLMPVRIITNGTPIVRNTFQAMLYAAANGASVINLSFGRSGTFLQWEQDVISYLALDRDIVVVAASGNERFSGPVEQHYYPASYKYVLSVTGTYSSRGRLPDYVVSPHIDIAAPGFFIETTSNRLSWPFAAYTFQTSAYAAAGTSFAAPLASGTAVLVRAKYPELSALQVAELIRTTSDYHYDVSSNIPYEGRMGKGFLNAFRALDERPTAISIRADKHYLLDGQTVVSSTTREARLSVELLNYLNPASNVSVTITTDDPHVTLINDTFLIPAMPTMGRSDNFATPFRFHISSDHLNRTVRFRLNFSADGGYTDYQFLDVPIDADYLDVELNDFALTFTEFGRIGYLDKDYRDGRGLRFRNQLQCYEGGVFVSKSATQTSDALMNFFSPMRVLSQDFRADSTTFNPVLQQLDYAPNLRQLTASYADTFPGFHTPIPVHLTERVSGWDNPGNDNYLIWEYQVQNLGSTTLDELRLGMFLEVNLGNSSQNIAGWDPGRKIGYVRTPDSTEWLAFQLLNEADLGVPLRFTGFDLNDGTYPIQLLDGDGFSSADKHALLDPTNLLTGETPPANVAAAAGVALTNLSAGQSQTVRLKLIGAESLQEIDRALANKWIGRVSTDWYDPGNWLEGVPTAWEDVVIPAGVPHFPVIPSGTVQLNMLEIVQGASMTLANGRLELRGNFIVDGQFTGQAGTVLQTESNAISGAGAIHLHDWHLVHAVQVDAYTEVAGALDLSAGKLVLGNADMRLLPAATLPGVSPSHCIQTQGEGLLWQQVSSMPTLYPLAASDQHSTLGSLAPIQLENTGTTDFYGVRLAGYVPGYQHSLRARPQSPTEAVSAEVVGLTWLIREENSGGGNLKAGLSWSGSQQLAGFEPDKATLARSLRTDSLSWEALAPLGATGTAPYQLAGINLTDSLFALSVQEGATVSLSLSGTVQQVEEDSGEVLTFVVRRTGSLAGSLRVNFQISGAVNASDFNLSANELLFDPLTLSGSLLIPAGAAQASLYVRPRADANKELHEKLILRLSP